MTPERIVLVQTSFDRLLPTAETVAQQFYQQLFALDPALRQLFPANMQMQEHMLIAMINTAVNGLWHPDALVPVLQQLGRRHASYYGVQPQHYATLGQALLMTLRQLLGQEWSADIAAAWQAAYSFIAQAMQSGVSISPVDAT
jgi:hemoglobin-like flavoprotein